MKTKIIKLTGSAFLSIALCCFVSTAVKAQSGVTATSATPCAVTAFASATTINCGDTVFLGASGNQAVIVYTNNFNVTCPGPGWTGTSSATCSNPCGNGPSGGAGDPYLWMGNTATAPRNVTTVGYDVSNGGTICFDMRYASEEVCPGPGACAATALTCSCEGPDLPDEGVHLQYQKNGAGPWIDMQYWDPNGGCDPNLVNWNNHCVTIPPGAFGATTKFRWFQTASSSTDADHWGIDNVVITVPNLTYTFDWAHDAPQGPSTSPTTAGVHPTSTTTYTVTYTNGTCSTTGNVTVTVRTPTVTVTGGGTICAGQSEQLVANSSLVMTCPTTCGLSGSASCNPNNSKVGEHQVGFGATVNSCNSGTQNIFGDFNAEGAVRAQVIYTAAEILGSTGVNGSGAFTCGQLRALSFDFARLDAGDGGACSGVGSVLYRNLEIRIACIGAKSTFSSSSDWISGASLTTVYATRDVVVSGTGWKTFNFDQTYNWDNTSNIVVQICWHHNSGGQGSSAKVTSHAAASKVLMAETNSAGAASSWNCSSSNSFATVSGSRPNTRFQFCEPVAGTLTYSWTPSADLDNSTIYNPTATPAATTTYTVTVGQAGLPAACNSTGTATLTINPAPSLSLGYGSCSNGSTNLVANGLSYCNTTASAADNTGTLLSRCIVIPAGIGTYPTALLGVFVDITHSDINEVTNNAGTNATIEIQAPGTAGWTTLTGLTNGDKLWLGALPAGAGTPAVGTNVSGNWCIRFKDDTQGGLGDNGGLTFHGFCLNFTNGITGLTYSWTGPSGTPSSNQMITATANGVYTVTATDAAGCTSTATMNVTACGIVLPVELLSFDGQNLENKKVQLNWVTASEKNSDRFEIERSTDAVEFMPIGSVAAAGNSTTEKQYEFIDENPMKNFNYYRLKQIDKDGKADYSETVSVELNNKLITQRLRPVPATDKLFYDVNSPSDQNVIVEVYDLLGKQVISEIKALKTGANTLSTDVLTLHPGVYILKMSDSFGEPYIQKFIK